MWGDIPIWVNFNVVFASSSVDVIQQPKLCCFQDNVFPYLNLGVTSQKEMRGGRVSIRINMIVCLSTSSSLVISATDTFFAAFKFMFFLVWNCGSLWVKKGRGRGRGRERNIPIQPQINQGNCNWYPVPLLPTPEFKPVILLIFHTVGWCTFSISLTLPCFPWNPNSKPNHNQSQFQCLYHLHIMFNRCNDIPLKLLKVGSAFLCIYHLKLEVERSQRTL